MTGFHQYIVSPVDHVVSLLFNLLSRRFEFQADRFACKLEHGAALRAGLVRLQVGVYIPEYMTSFSSNPESQHVTEGCVGELEKRARKQADFSQQSPSLLSGVRAQVVEMFDKKDRERNI
jgi:Zn-dependent protease with chaperone function